jgi:hypothetical protein
VSRASPTISTFLRPSGLRLSKEVQSWRSISYPSWKISRQQPVLPQRHISFDLSEVDHGNLYPIVSERLIAQKGYYDRWFTAFGTCSCCPPPPTCDVQHRTPFRTSQSCGQSPSIKVSSFASLQRWPPTLRNQRTYTTCLYGCKDENSHCVRVANNSRSESNVDWERTS